MACSFNNLIESFQLSLRQKGKLEPRLLLLLPDIEESAVTPDDC